MQSTAKSTRAIVRGMKIRENPNENADIRQAARYFTKKRQ